MVQNIHCALIVMEGQPSAKITAIPNTPMNRQSVPSVTPKPPRKWKGKRQPCATCQQPNCHKGSHCGNDHTLSPLDQVTFPVWVPQRPSVDAHRECPPHHPRANRTLSLTTDPLAPPTMSQKPRRPRTTRKVSDPSTIVPLPQPTRPPSRTGAPEHPGSPTLPQYNPHGRGRKIPGPPPVGPKPQQRRATSRSSAHGQDPTPRQPPLRLIPHCRNWLKGNCLQGSNCPFIHDLVARAAEERRLKEAAEEFRLKKAAEELRLKKIAEEQAAKIAEEHATKIAEEQAAKTAQEAAATIEETVLPSTRVTFGAGVTVKKVLTGQETCKVLVKNLPLTATKAEVVTLFTQPGFDPAKFTVYPPRPSPNDRSHREAAVEFEDPEDGKNAVAGLDGIEFGSEKLKLVIAPKQGGMGKSKDRDSHTLTVTWPAPSDTVFAAYSSLDEANSMITQLEKKTFNGRRIKANMAKKPSNLPDTYWNSATISVKGLEPDASLGSIQDFCGTTSIRIATRNTRNYNLNDAIPSLQTLALEAHPGNNESVTWEPNLVPNEYGNASAKIHFPTWEHAKAVHDFLDQKPLPICTQAKCYVSLPDPLHYTISVPHPQYKAQEKLFRSLVPAKNDRSATARLRIPASQPDRLARIELSGSDKKTIGRLKVRIEQLVVGERLPQWDRVFYGAEGESFLKKVNDETQAYIRVDKRQSTLRAFGEPAAVEQAKAMIQEEVDRLASLQFEVFLKRASVRFFVDGARGSELLKQEVGEENVRVDVSSIPFKIVIRGGESARHCLKKLIDESLSDAVRSQHQLKDGEICPVCYDSIDQPYRLGCGHAYCYGCLRHFLISASDTKQFPLSCMGDEGSCGLPVPLPVIQRFLVPAQVKRLLEVSFFEHLGRHPDEFRYCTTPDCTEIYSLESSSGDGIFRCGSCFVSVCVLCQEDHDGFSCEEWKVHRDPETQDRKLLDSWIEGKDVKKCPKCGILIEKNGGCNHMTCPKCDAHICWWCMGIFPAGEIYNHMELVHVGI